MQEKNEEHFVGLVAQKAFIVKGETVLMVRNAGDQRWDFPGGRLHKDELPRDGLLRELQEELGCKAEVQEVVYINQYFHGAAGKPCLFVNYLVGLELDTVISLAEDELSEFDWINLGTLESEETFPNCLDTLNAYRKRPSEG